jgi:hypothetical protein
MRLSTLAVPLFGALTLVACSHKETVVERPVVERQTVIERPVPAAGATCSPRLLLWRRSVFGRLALLPERLAVPLQQRQLEPDARLLLAV